MAIIAGKIELSRALALLGKLVPAKSRVEALGCVRFEVSGGIVSILGTSLDEHLKCSLPEARATGEAESFLAPLAALREFLRCGVKDSSIRLDALPNGGAKVSEVDEGAEAFAKELPAPPLAEWPEFPKTPEKLFNAPVEFLDAIRQAAPSSSQKDFRRALGCVYVNEGLAVATDGHHLVALPCASPFEKGFLLKPTKMLEQLKGGCKVGIDLPEKGKGAGRLHVISEGVAWSVALCDADYPNWRQVVPHESGLRLSVSFDERSALSFLKAIPALKSKEGSIVLRCGPGGVLAGGSFRTDAVFNGIKELEIELSAANVSRALGLGMRELKMSDAFSPVLFKDGKGAFMASMPLRQKTVQKPITNKENSSMTKQSVTAPQQPQAPAPVAAQGFNVVHSQQPNAPQADPFEDLVKSAEEVKGAARASYEAASQFTRKLRELQASLKRKEREQKSTRELIEKLKTASGF